MQPHHICFISPVYIGSICDAELTRISGFLTILKGKPRVSIMADHGFTITFLHSLKVDVQAGRKIPSLHIHVEKLLGG